MFITMEEENSKCILWETGIRINKNEILLPKLKKSEMATKEISNLKLV